MIDTVSIRPTKLYRLRDNLPHEEMVVCLAAGIRPDEILWLVGNRRARSRLLVEYYGEFRQTYKQAMGYSPTGTTWKNMPMRYFVPVE